MSLFNSSNAYASIISLFKTLPQNYEEFLPELLKAIQEHPMVMHERDAESRTLLHHASSYSYLSVDWVKVLVGAPGGLECVKTIDVFGCLPIHNACRHGKVEMATYFFSLYPESINAMVMHERDDKGGTLLHHAALQHNRVPVDLVKVLVEAPGGAECVKTIDIFGCLPIHNACRRGNVEMAKYFFSLYPESINVHWRDSKLLHLVAQTTRLYCFEEEQEELTRFLLRHDQSASTMPDHHGNLPLHLACHYSNFSVAKILYDAYPQAITMQNNDQETPSDLAPRCNSSYNHVSGSGLVFEWFIETQLEWKGRAQGIVEPDANGQLPIHLLLQKPEPPLGTIKLMADANRASLTTADNQGFLPLHVSCKFGHLDIFKYLSGSDEDSLKTKTSRGYLPLHIACLAGKCHVVNYILERSDFGVASRIHGKLPLELLLSNVANGDRNNLEFVEAVFRLLRANPEIIYKWDVADNLNFDDLKLEWARRKSMRLQSLDNFFKNYSL